MGKPTLVYNNSTGKIIAWGYGAHEVPQGCTLVDSPIGYVPPAEGLMYEYYDKSKKTAGTDTAKKAEAAAIASEEAKIAAKIYDQQRATAISALGSELKIVKK